MLILPNTPGRRVTVSVVSVRDGVIRKNGRTHRGAPAKVSKGGTRGESVQIHSRYFL